MEDAKKASEEAAAQKAADSQDLSETPDYAAGLTSTNPPTPSPAPKASVIRETGTF